MIRLVVLACLLMPDSANASGLSDAVAACEARIISEGAKVRPDRLMAAEVIGTDGARFTADRRFEHLPGHRLMLFPAIWDHILKTVVLTYSISPEPASVVFTCTMNARGEAVESHRL